LIGVLEGIEKMFEVSSESNLSMVGNVPSSKTSTKSKTPRARTKPRVKSEGFPGLVALLSKWNPSNPEFTRNLLVGELRTALEAESYACIYSCVPALIVDGKYPVEIMHFRTKDDIDEFVTRMVWMQEVFKSAVGLLVGVPDEETSRLIEDVCSSLLKMEEDCVIRLL